MPQVAQQDYILLQISDLGETTAQDKAVLLDAYKRGVIFDAIIQSGSEDKEFARVINVEVSGTDVYISVFAAGAGEIVQIALQ